MPIGSGEFNEVKGFKNVMSNSSPGAYAETVSPRKPSIKGSVYVPAMGAGPANVTATPVSVSVVESKVNEPEMSSMSPPRIVAASGVNTHVKVSALASDKANKRITTREPT